ncbi:MAG: glutathione-regulated potassium-efflux system protein KefC [Aquabacterium sp.]
MEHVPHWLLNALIFLTAAVVAVPISRALGLGSIIGYLLAGALIGPWGLGLMTQVQDILHFAEFGVVLMLFLVGLELEPQRLWRLRVPIFGHGSLQMLGCTIALSLPAAAIGLGWTPSVIAALGLSLSSTAIALQVMDELHLTQTPAGQTGFAVLLFQDLAAIPILALLPVLAATPHAGASLDLTTAAWAIGKALLAVAGVMIGARLLLRPLLRWIAASRTAEIFTAAALLLVAALAVLMQALGLSMALGAFLGGVLLADSEYRRELETDIEPFKGLLMGLFFIAVGMGIDLGVLMSRPLALLGLVAGFIAIKVVVIACLLRRIEGSARQRHIVTLMLAQGGEFAFVVFQAAGPDLLPRQTASLLTGAVAFSMLLSPLLLMALERMLAGAAHTPGRDTEVPELDGETPKVIICGFGRYGQIVARMLGSQDVATIVLDHDPDTIDNARDFGSKVYYGDATRLDLLKAAGAESAAVIVVAVDDVQASLDIVDMVKAHFPQLKIAARARNVGHLYQLLDRQVDMIEREVFDASLLTAQSVLQTLGWRPEEADEVRHRFRAANLRLTHASHAHHKDRAKLIAVSKEGRRQFQEQMARERAEKAASRPAAAVDPMPGPHSDDAA